MAMKSARRGFFVPLCGVGSVLGFIRVRLFGNMLVERRFGDAIFFGGPVAEVQNAAAVAAKREVRMRLRIRRILASRAMPFHRTTRRSTL